MNNTTAKLKIAIDGFSAAGKSTVSKELAKSLNLLHLETGIFYRLATHVHCRTQYNLDSDKDIIRFMDDVVVHEDTESHTFLFTLGDTMYNRSILEIDGDEFEIMSRLAKNPFLRNEVHTKVSDIANSTKRVIFEGREVCTYVQDLDYRFFFDAPLEMRVQRRAQQINQPLEKVRREIMQRDLKDATFISNLNVREHGIKTFSNDYASLEESVAVLLKIIKSG